MKLFVTNLSAILYLIFSSLYIAYLPQTICEIRLCEGITNNTSCEIMRDYCLFALNCEIQITVNRCLEFLHACLSTLILQFGTSKSDISDAVDRWIWLTVWFQTRYIYICHGLQTTAFWSHCNTNPSYSFPHICVITRTYNVMIYPLLLN